MQNYMKIRAKKALRSSYSAWFHGADDERQAERLREFWVQRAMWLTAAGYEPEGIDWLEPESFTDVHWPFDKTD